MNVRTHTTGDETIIRFSPSMWGTILAILVALVSAVSAFVARPTRVEVQEMIDRSQSEIRTEIRHLRDEQSRTYEAIKDLGEELRKRE